MNKVKLTKLSTNQNNLRTNDVTGECMELPVVGKRFTMYGQGLETPGIRLIQTSEVKKIDVDSDKVIRFTTEFSEYQLEKLET